MAGSLLADSDTLGGVRRAAIVTGRPPKRRSRTGGGGDKKGTKDAIGASLSQLSGLSVMGGLVGQVARGGPDTGVGAGPGATSSKGRGSPGSRRGGSSSGASGAAGAEAAGANDGPDSPGPFAHGGLVRKSDLGRDVDGPGGEGGTIQVKGGEFVMRADAVRKYGPEIMKRINEGKIPPSRLRGSKLI